MVTKFVKEHTCVVDYKRVGHRQATSWVIGDCLKNRYIAHSQTFKPKNIVDDVRERFGIQITYNKAWRAREAAYDSLWYPGRIIHLFTIILTRVGGM